MNLFLKYTIWLRFINKELKLPNFNFNFMLTKSVTLDKVMPLLLSDEIYLIS